MSAPTQALYEYGNAIRGDWGCIDGRSVRDDLQDIAAAIDNGDTRTIEAWRTSLGICANGGGHWDDYCSVDDCGAEW